MSHASVIEKRIDALSATKRHLLAGRLGEQSRAPSPGAAGGRVRLTAFVTVAASDTSDPEPTADNLRAHLGELLPEYMVPTHVQFIDSLPLLPNGKVDVTTLTSMPLASNLDENSWIDPRNPTEQVLADIWCEVLQVDCVSVLDNFFELGGDSLLAITLLSKIKQNLGVSPHLNTLWFGAETIEDQANVIADLESGEGEGASRTVVMQAGGAGLPLFCIHTIGGGNLFHYSLLVEHLTGNRPVYGLQARGIDGVEPPDNGVEAMASYCIESMRAIQSEGPYLLCGFSTGGVIAYEMARQLTAQSECDIKLIMIDTYFPGHPESFSEVMGNWLDRIKNKEYRYMQERAYHAALGLLGLQRLRRLQAMGESHRWALWNYVAKPYPGQLIYIQAGDGGKLEAPQHVPWSKLAQDGIHLVKIPGSHGHVVHEPHVSELACRIDEILQGI